MRSAWVVAKGLLGALGFAVVVGACASTNPGTVTLSAQSATTTASPTLRVDGPPIVHVLDPQELVPAKTESGSCWTGSQLSGAANAWRCIVGNVIYDPCFTRAEEASVICPLEWPNSLDGLEIDLESPLPAANARTNSSKSTRTPYRVLLTDGRVCVAQPGGTFGVDGKRANFACGSEHDFWLIGSHTVTASGAWTWQGVQLPGPEQLPPKDAPLITVRIAEAWEE